MGTRSLTYFQEDGVNIACMYRQFDGYPDGHGKALKEWAGSRDLINGIGGHDSSQTSWNGIGCLAADCIASFKDHIGGIYLYHPETVGDVDYTYTLYKTNQDSKRHRDGKPAKMLGLRVESNRVLFDGLMIDFDPHEDFEIGYGDIDWTEIYDYRDDIAVPDHVVDALLDYTDDDGTIWLRQCKRLDNNEFVLTSKYPSPASIRLLPNHEIRFSNEARSFTSASPGKRLEIRHQNGVIIRVLDPVHKKLDI